MLPWFAFPACRWPAGRCGHGARTGVRHAATAAAGLSALTFLMLALAYRPREIPALLMLPPLALLATPGALTLRRGAANAFDWFAMMTFSLFAGRLAGWSAMALGWPEKLAKRVVVLRPGFVGQFDLLAFVIGLAATAWWIWLIVTAPRSPYRSLTHWTLGFTTLWLLATTLILPWFDYGKSYRPVAQAIAKPCRRTMAAWPNAA
jgi:4-amino-4-deoxy-L-arabinose transferase-like glycosyltransferase